jgi:hypothetical protein
MGDRGVDIRKKSGNLWKIKEKASKTLAKTARAE